MESGIAVANVTRDIVFFVYPGFQMLDLSGPLSVFELAGKIAARDPYRIHIVSPAGGPVRSSCGLEILTKSAQPSYFDTLLVVGAGAPDTPVQEIRALAGAVETSSNGARRIASVCTGAFILAAIGRFEGKRVTTHWKYAALLQRSFPGLKVEVDRIFIKDGDIWSSAGISAGIDLALAMVEEDLGTTVSHATAQMLVVYHRRPGGQSQFSALLDMEPESDRIRKVLTYIREHLSEKLSTDRLAEVACLSPRQFTRSFLTETGETPAKAVERLRAEVARQRVERGTEPIELIARSVGFVDPERMRRAFLRIFGQPPQSVRRMAAHDTSVLSTPVGEEARDRCRMN
ncbi:GlxA family transcriptional regulator [Rhizobium sp. BT-175]|uniref:GlxA family transcriptional regulator n=1 Tax=Rhizobium sp. BT-175 TaxID=2986929 RepID=UPI0022363D72|nr:GlxA family transcriptional regulator [Rhizobium sp. BT-175]MCV9947594.1 GlxA family transcriptional regulator [Rhizobium sp. BT-175]